MTPIASVVLMGVADSILRTTGADTLHFMVCLILAAVAVISTLMNFAFYGKTMRIITLSLCLISVLFMYTEFKDPDIQQTTPTGNTTGSYTYKKQDTVSFGGGSGNFKRNDACTACNGSKKCHVCKGKGSFYCNGMYCLRGKCTSCNGSGLYDHGSYVSKCLTYKGDGIRG